MIATIRYVDSCADKKCIFEILSLLNINIIWTQAFSFGIHRKIKFNVEDVDKLNEILFILNKNTLYGVEFISYRPTFKEILSKLFSK